MKWILVIAAFVAMPVNAALIEYTYELTTYKLGLDGILDTSPATATLLVDTTDETIKQFSYNNKFNNFSWSGQISPGIHFTDPDISQYGFDVSITIKTPGVSIYSIYLEHNLGDFNGSALNYLDTLNLNESVFDYWLDSDIYNYGGEIHTTRKRVVSVPEPATISLLFLCLAAIGIRRRLR